MKQLVAYITAGYPDVNFSVDLALALREAGADILELGVPFSDPVADGPVIEAANLLALKSGFKTDMLFEIAKQVAPKITTYFMGYFNPFYHKGVDYFASKARELGVSGFIIPDLPFEEARSYKHLLEGMGLYLVDFIAPTHTSERIAKIAKDSLGFIYLVAYAGITGSGKDEDLKGLVASIKTHNSQTPVFVGFGVDENSAREKAKHADGVIVGSAFVKILLNENLTKTQKVDKIALLARNIKEMINE
ncbi:MAG: tryptophan synthase subunit alpha [Campylobacteraceae bacterium]|jgi:tryptophan synthase alpha chain|nr:tryptophan synthase subunit alpha [Campylobacteraceae bacterium]